MIGIGYWDKSHIQVKKGLRRLSDKNNLINSLRLISIGEILFATTIFSRSAFKFELRRLKLNWLTHGGESSAIYEMLSLHWLYKNRFLKN